MAIIPISPLPGTRDMYYNAGAPTNGSTYAGIAPVGALLTDTTNAELYINQGTQASPTWAKVSAE